VQIIGNIITSYDAPLWNHTDLDGSPLPDEKQPFNIIKKSLKTALNIQHGITCPDGTVVILSINASPLKGHNGEFNGMIASIEDITEYKLAEKELILSEKHNVFLAQTASDLVEFSSIQEIYKYTVHKLYELFKGNSVVALVEYDYSTNRWKMKQVEGIGKKAAELSRLLGVNINNLEGDISVKYYEQITGGKVAELEFDLTGLFNRKLSAAVGSAVKKMFSVEKMYCIAFEQDEQIIGNITFTTNKKSEPINKKLIETFVKQVSTIIKKQKAEERLKESENFYKVTFEEAAVGIAHVLPNGYFFKVNKKFCDILGYDAAELTEMNIIDISFAEDIEEENKYISQVLSNKIDSYIIEKRYRHKQGHQIWVRLHSNVVKNKHGEIEFAVASISDITERIQVELALKQSELQNRTILQTALDGFWIVDTEGRFTEVNNAYCQLTGYSREELLTMSITDVEVLESEAMVYQRIQRLLQNGSDRFESKHRCKDGRILEVEVSVNLLKNDKKIFVFMHDITEQKLAEESLRLSEEKQRYLLQHLHAGVVVHAADSSILFANEHASQLLGLTLDQMMGKTAFDPAWHFVGEDFLRIPIEQYPVQYVIENKIPLREQVFGINRPETNDQVWVLVNAFPEYEANGRLRQVVVTFIDISGRKQTELIILKKTEEIGFHNQRMESLLKISQYKTHSIQELLDFALNEAITLTNSKIGYIYFYTTVRLKNK
jgi:PAS domain S-box-containing protein